MILDILTHPEKAQKMRRASRTLAKNHSFQSSLEHFELLYAELSAQRNPQPTALVTWANHSWQRAKKWMSEFYSLELQ